MNVIEDRHLEVLAEEACSMVAEAERNRETSCGSAYLQMYKVIHRFLAHQHEVDSC